MNQKRNKKGILIILFSLLICVPITFTIVTINTMALTNEVETNNNETTIELEKEDIPSELIFVDIKPGSWPNPINLKSKGVIPIAICGTEEFDVTTIDPSTIVLRIETSEEEVSPLRWSYEDVATPYTGEEGCGHELNGDGIIDLVLHFSTKEVIENLGLSEYEGKAISLIIKGNLYGENEEEDGTTIQGKDFVWILGKVLKPFSIDNSGMGDYTWEEASKQPWCKGKGTSENPYVIKNIAIDGENSGSCLEIRNSDVHFIIKNSKFYNGTLGNAALLLFYVDNAMIVSNDVSNNYGSGISILYSNEIKIIDNDCSENNLGIYILYSNNIEISKNFCEENTWGIVLEGNSQNNIVSRNICSKNSEDGIVLYSNVIYNVVDENDCSENYLGIVLLDWAHYNSVTGNLVSNNHIGIAVVDGSSYNTFTDNEIVENTIVGTEPAPFNLGIGIFVGNTNGFTGSPPSNNGFYHNNIINNPNQAFDMGEMNYWDFNGEGNYWSDYSDVDENPKDGIWDNPYLVPSLAGSEDLYPFVHKNGWL